MCTSSTLLYASTPSHDLSVICDVFCLQDIVTVVSFYLSYCLIAALFVCSLFSDLSALRQFRRRQQSERTPLLETAIKSNPFEAHTVS